MLKTLRSAAICAVIMAGAAQAQSFSRQNFDIPVYPLSDRTFEVIENDGAGGGQMWCAAAKYAREVLGQGRGNLYLARARGPSQSVSGRRGVIFSLDPVPQSFSSVSLSVRRAGQTASIGLANAVCPRGASRLRISVGG
ncbi:hypothetical protein [Sulfitobacter sp. S190]|uniref:hypothetical protein n=1 Tax=Sulfitobacter sp. S190 TaxID=2867022 RepID=UPI0021A44F12|nr:hypothetical protein [Sulfitobacter sp. S190]UWR23544.1 hypothetical protein K3756_06085 [Sulfitobacter sp. S190]